MSSIYHLMAYPNSQVHGSPLTVWWVVRPRGEGFPRREELKRILKQMSWGHPRFRIHEVMCPKCIVNED